MSAVLGTSLATLGVLGFCYTTRRLSDTISEFQIGVKNKDFQSATTPAILAAARATLISKMVDLSVSLFLNMGIIAAGIAAAGIAKEVALLTTLARAGQEGLRCWAIAAVIHSCSQMYLIFKQL